MQLRGSLLLYSYRDNDARRCSLDMATVGWGDSLGTAFFFILFFSLVLPQLQLAHTNN